MAQFLACSCKRGYFERLLTTYKEYRQLERGFSDDREFWDRKVRDLCFFSIAPHRGKASTIKSPSDLWKIGDEAEPIVNNINTPKHRRLRKLMKRDLATKGITLV